MTDDRLLTMTEAAERLRAPIDTLRHWRKVGKGPQGFKIGRRVVYSENELNRWIEAQRRAS